MPRPTIAKLEAEMRKLKAENRQLSADLAKQKASTTQHARARPSVAFWRRLAVVFCMAIAVALLAVGNIIFWAGDTIVDNDKYVKTVAPLAQNSQVQTAVATYTTQQLFKNVDTESITQAVLPPKADFLAPALQSQLQTYTQSTLKKIVASPKFQTVWVNTQSKAHERLINTARTYKGDGSIDLSDIYKRLSGDLKDTKLSFLANKPLPSKVGSIQVVDAPWLPKLHLLVTHIGAWKFWATALVIVTSTLAIWLSRNRRRATIMLGWYFVIALLATLIAMRITRESVAAQVSQPYQEAIREAIQVIFHPLVVQTTTLLLGALLIVVVAWISGPSKLAATLRTAWHQLLNGNLRHVLFGNSENTITTWVARYKSYLQWGIVLLLAVIMLLVRLTPKTVIVYGILMGIFVALIEFIAAPAASQEVAVSKSIDKSKSRRGR